MEIHSTRDGTVCGKPSFSRDTIQIFQYLCSDCRGWLVRAWWIYIQSGMVFLILVSRVLVMMPYQIFQYAAVIVDSIIWFGSYSAVRTSDPRLYWGTTAT